MDTEKKTLGQKIWDHKILTLLLVAIVALTAYRLAIFASEKMNPEEEEVTPVNVKVITAEYGSITQTTPLSGRITPVDEVAIVPLASGQVTAVYAEVGDYVHAGSVLFEIDKGQIITTYNQAKAAYDLAATTYANMEELYAEGAVSKSDYDSARVQYISAEESFNAAAEAYSYYSVTSPIDGYVTSMSVSVGSIAGQSMAASVADTSALEISTTVSEYLASMINVGDEVNVYVSSLGDEPYKGTITEFSPAPAMGTLTYPVTISLENKNGDLMSGMFAEVEIVTDEAENTICIPSDAVILKDSKSVAVLLDSENIPRYSEVSTGIDNGSYVQILSGVNEGDIVVVSGQDFVTEGEAVNITE